MALTKDAILQLTDDNLLKKIAEEASEVIKAAMKMSQFGATPFFQGVQYNNVRDVIEEYEQLNALVSEFYARFHYLAK